MLNLVLSHPAASRKTRSCPAPIFSSHNSCLVLYVSTLVALTLLTCYVVRGMLFTSISCIHIYVCFIFHGPLPLSFLLPRITIFLWLQWCPVTSDICRQSALVYKRRRPTMEHASLVELQKSQQVISFEFGTYDHRTAKLPLTFESPDRREWSISWSSQARPASCCCCLIVSRSRSVYVIETRFVFLVVGINHPIRFLTAIIFYRHLGMKKDNVDGRWMHHR